MKTNMILQNVTYKVNKLKISTVATILVTVAMFIPEIW